VLRATALSLDDATASEMTSPSPVPRLMRLSARYLPFAMTSTSPSPAPRSMSLLRAGSPPPPPLAWFHSGLSRQVVVVASMS